MNSYLVTGPKVSLNSYAYKRSISLLIFLFCVNVALLHAQKPQWVQVMYSDHASVSEVSALYESYYDTHDFEKNKFTQDYKRFLREKSREAFESDITSDLRSAQKAYRQKLSAYRNNPAAWQAIGPFDVDLNSAAAGVTPGLAHVYTVEKDGFLVAGTATAGVWKSTNNGTSWTPITHNLMVTEVKAVEVRGSTIFFGGNGHIYKSTNGGSSWASSGNSNFKSQYHRTADIVSTSSAYYAATNYGLYKSTDTGSNWVQKLSGNFLEVEIHPTNTSIVYAVSRQGSGTVFHRSEDGGETFTAIQNGYPVVGSGEQLRTEIAVTAANPNRVVALATGEANGGSGLYGIYVSDDTGLTWEFRCCGTGPGGPASATNKNIMTWSTSGEVSGGQYYYDLALAISQSDEDEIYAGGINIWKSTDGGTSFFNNADYIFRNAGEKYVHADIQDIRTYGDEIWVATDGGIFMSDDGGATFSKRMRGIVATDFRGFGAGAKDGQVLIGGTYHNGTLLKDRNTYEGGFVSTYSGDNTLGQVNPQNNRLVYGDMGMLTLTGSASSSPSIKTLTLKPNKSYKTGESSEYAFHPTSGEIFFLGSGGSLYKTTDNGTNFSQLSNFGSGKVTKIEISPSDPDVIYVVYYPSYEDHKKLFKTEDGGATWEDVSPAATVFQNTKLWMAWDIAVSSTNPEELWLARTPQTSSNGLANGSQVFKTENGGASWSNVSSPSLNGEMITNIVHHHGTDGGVYIGTRRSVFYKNDAMPEWMIFQGGLPALTYSTQLVILYSEGKLVNATQRGIYATDLHEEVVKNVAMQVDRTQGICENDVFTFSNNSTGFSGDVSVKWTFQNGTPAVSYDENPSVRFSGVGSHDVSLEVIENGTPHVEVEQDLITITNDCRLSTIAGSAIKTRNGNFLMIPELGVETNEITFSTWVKRSGTTKNNAGLITMRRFSRNTGLSVSSSGQVKYMWDKEGLGISTDLVIPKDEWTHIAMSVSPTSISVYVNGIERAYEGSYAPVSFDKNILVGKDANSIIYYFNGAFDEVSVFAKTLTTKEVRAHMNLVKEEEKLPSLSHYYQFNDQGDLASDIVGSKHASFFSDPDYVESMAPVGRGISEVKKIETFGMHTFAEVDVDLNIESGISCNSDLGVYKIERNVNGSSDSHSSDYLYIVNHFSEENFAINGEITIARAFQELESTGVTKDSFKLYQLDYDASPEWDSNERAYAMDFEPDNDERIVFEVDEAREMEGKFLVSYNMVNAALAVSDIYFKLSVVNLEEVQVQWFLHPEDDFIMTELQRSGDGRRFETIETINNERGVLDFSYLDKDPLVGRNYYRVKMTYANGEQDFSKIDYIRLDSKTADQFLFPNPSHGGIVKLKDIRTDDASLDVYDMTGKRIMHMGNIDNGVLDISGLSEGVYVVVVEERTARRQQLLVVSGR